MRTDSHCLPLCQSVGPHEAPCEGTKSATSAAAAARLLCSSESTCTSVSEVGDSGRPSECHCGIPIGALRSIYKPLLWR